MIFKTMCMCDQQSLRSACAYAQSDQSHCQSLEYSMIVKLLSEHHLEFLSLTGGCTGSSESTLVKMPHCWKSHAAAQLFLQLWLSAANTLYVFHSSRLIPLHNGISLNIIRKSLCQLNSIHATTPQYSHQNII